MVGMAMNTIENSGRSARLTVVKPSRRRWVRTIAKAELDWSDHTEPERHQTPESSDRPERREPADISPIARTRITRALARFGEIDATKIDVDVHDQVATLRGQVRCWSERAIVEQIAWATPAVLIVRNDLAVVY
jgi:hypothetical protein